MSPVVVDGTDLWSCRGWLVFFVWWLGWLGVFVFCLVVCLVSCCLFSRSFPFIALSRKRCEAYLCLSEWALDLLWRLMSLVRYVVVSLSDGLPVSERSAAACEEKKLDY